jgi:hypothetical protein
LYTKRVIVYLSRCHCHGNENQSHVKYNQKEFHDLLSCEFLIESKPGLEIEKRSVVNMDSFGVLFIVPWVTAVSF